VAVEWPEGQGVTYTQKQNKPASKDLKQQFAYNNNTLGIKGASG